jgi:hypothetical protein
MVSPLSEYFTIFRFGFPLVFVIVCIALVRGNDHNRCLESKQLSDWDWVSCFELLFIIIQNFQFTNELKSIEEFFLFFLT